MARARWIRLAQMLDQLESLIRATTEIDMLSDEPLATTRPLRRLVGRQVASLQRDLDQQVARISLDAARTWILQREKDRLADEAWRASRVNRVSTR